MIWLNVYQPILEVKLCVSLTYPTFHINTSIQVHAKHNFLYEMEQIRSKQT